MLRLADWFRDETCLTIVDVGASIGEVPTYQNLVDSGVAKLLGFEPDADECRRLNERYFEKGHQFFPYFLGNGGVATFYQTNHGFTGSLYKPNVAAMAPFSALPEYVVLQAEHEVQTHRLDDVASQFDIDFMKIDIQGGELDVFKNGEKTLGNTLLIQTEVEFIDIYESQPLFSDVEAYLRSIGFRFHDFVGFGGRSFKPLLNTNNEIGAFRQKVWADAYFVRDWTLLSQLSTEKLLRFSILLNDVVSSFDLAYLCLSEIDRREGGGLAEQYRTALSSAKLIKEINKPENKSSIEIDKFATADRKLQLADFSGIKYVLPDDISCLTTYVLLEQGRWFEKEIDFVTRYLQPGMNAIDVGANLGVYALAMGRMVGNAGQVIAFEPGTQARTCLELSVALNELKNIEISPLALGEAPHEGWLSCEVSCELNLLLPDGAGHENAERVHVSTLDHEILQRLGSYRVDFIKIDAELYEAEVLVGGKQILRNASPLVMIEVRHGDRLNGHLCRMLQLLDYEILRVSGSGEYLIPMRHVAELDLFSFNVFAAKKDTIKLLLERELLVDCSSLYSLSNVERDFVIEKYLGLPFAKYYEITADDVNKCPFGNALIYFYSTKVLEMGAGRKHAALKSAQEIISAYLEVSADSLGAMYLLIRVCSEIGERKKAIDLAEKILSKNSFDLNDPFFPAFERYDQIDPCEAGPEWLLASCAEYYSLFFCQSSRVVVGDISRLNWLASLSFASDDVLRRCLLANFFWFKKIDDQLLLKIYAGKEKNPRSRIFTRQFLEHYLVARR